MHVIVEVHYQRQMPVLSTHAREDRKYATDMVNLQEKILRTGAM
jgi:hypothetical protein